MRKNAGFMMLTLLLLIVPALANAWTLTVKVAGGNANNSVAVTYPTSTSLATTATKTIKSGTAYLYPTKAGVTAVIAGTPTIALDGSTVDVANRLGALTSGNHVLQVVYVADDTTSLTLTQAVGGQIYAQNRNNTWSAAGVSGLPVNTIVNLTISADNNYNIVGYKVGTVQTDVSPCKVYSFSKTATGQTIQPVFAVDAKISASLFAPTNGVAGQAITLSVAATTNDAGLQYAFSTDGGVTYSAFANAATFTFTPAEGSYTAVAKVKTANNGNFTTPAAVIAVANAQVAANSECVSCHSTQSPQIVAGGTSVHACTVCHTAEPHLAGSINPLPFNREIPFVDASFKTMTTNVMGLTTTGSLVCAACHYEDSQITTILIPHASNDTYFTDCRGCHTPNGTGTVHSISKMSCVSCHDVARDAGIATDNDGVRAIIGEFAKRSHHVTGREIKDSDCAVCHMEGKKNDNNEIGVNSDFHMNNDVIDLRNGNTNLVGNQVGSVNGAYPWSPVAPDHGLMDRFCFSCHNEAGAPTAAAALAGVTGYTGTALNPFGDTVSNSYDQVSRVNVVGVYEQFDTGNSSHHAVRGQKYTTNTLVGNTAVFTAISTANAGYRTPAGAAPVKGIKSTIGTMSDLNFWTATYTTLDGDELADDITIHCGDCHTVGQFRQADVNTAAGSFNKAVIGAHGSNNEYMLRNSNGDDVQAKDALVCYICHKAERYAGGATSSAPRHDGVPGYGWHCNGDEMNSSNLVGAARLRPAEGGLDDAGFQTELAEGKYAADGGANIFGIKCANCHNASDAKTFGGIHGNAGNASYQTYSGGKAAASDPTVVVSRKPYRFMPGLGNFRYNGGDSSDQWAIKTVSSANKQSCYTLNGASTVKELPNSSRTYAEANHVDNRSNLALAGDNGILGSWGACSDHAGTSISGGAHDPSRDILRPLTY